MAKVTTEVLLDGKEELPTTEPEILAFLDQHIAKFEKFYRPKSGTPLIPLERDILRKFLWWQIKQPNVEQS